MYEKELQLIFETLAEEGKITVVTAEEWFKAGAAEITTDDLQAAIARIKTDTKFLDFDEVKQTAIYVAMAKQIAPEDLIKNLAFVSPTKFTKPDSGKTVCTFKDYKMAVFEELRDHERISGVKWKRYSPLNNLLKGFRLGEITVLSGLTGRGKTTFLAEYSLDLCIEGVKTLWLNLELPNEKLLATMMTQFSKMSLKKEIFKFPEVAATFEKLGMYLLEMYNTKKTVEQIMELMETTIKDMKIQHVVVDNLQFLMSFESPTLVGFDNLRLQDRIFSCLRDITRLNKCHLTIVIHPKKEAKLQLNSFSIAGTGVATQQSDNIILLQCLKDSQYLEIVKNRFSGDIGCIELVFDRSTLCYEMKAIEETF